MSNNQSFQRFVIDTLIIIGGFLAIILFWAGLEKLITALTGITFPSI